MKHRGRPTKQTKKLTQEDFIKIVELRKQGWSYLRLGAMFDVDHSTIIYHLKRANDPTLIKIASLANKGVSQGMTPHERYLQVMPQMLSDPEATRLFFLNKVGRPPEHPFLESERKKKVKVGKSYQGYLLEKEGTNDILTKARKKSGDKFSEFYLRKQLGEML